MKKRLIAFVVSIAMVTGSVGGAQVLAAETTAVEAVEIAQDEETVEPEVLDENEDADAGFPTEDVSEEETGQAALDESVQEADEETSQEEGPAQEEEKITDEDEAGEETSQVEEPVFDEVSVPEEATEVTEPERLEVGKEPASAGSTRKNVAQAIWTEENTTFYFYYGPEVFSGEFFKGNKVTAVWRGTDVTDTGTRNPKWVSDEPPTELWEEVFDYPVMLYVTRVVFDNSFKVVRPKSLYGWFAYCSSMKNLDIRGLDTSEVTTMNSMFMDCGLGNIKLTGLNTSKVTDMGKMFCGCYNLKTANLSGLDTSNVTRMNAMFSDCRSLSEIDMSGCTTSKVTIMSGMFRRCVNLTDVDVSGFDTSNVTNMDGMFDDCYSLASVDVSGFDTSNVTDMRYMFYDCYSLASVDVSSFDISEVTHMESMFTKCKNLRAVFCSNSSTEWEKINVNLGGMRMFDGCTSLVGRDGSAKVPYNDMKTDSSMAKAASLGGYFTPKASAYLQLGKTSRGDMFNLANNVKVTWKEVLGAKYYKVYRSGVKDPVIVTTGLVGWDKEPGLVNGQKYTYKIVASLTGKGDDSGDSPLSYSKVMYRLKTVVIRSVKNTAPGKVTVKYDKTTSGDSYVLQYSEKQDMTGAKTKVVLGANNTSYVIGGLKKGKTYYISIRVRKKVDGIDYYTTFGVPKKVTITQ